MSWRCRFRGGVATADFSEAIDQWRAGRIPRLAKVISQTFFCPTLESAIRSRAGKFQLSLFGRAPH